MSHGTDQHGNTSNEHTGSVADSNVQGVYIHPSWYWDRRSVEMRRVAMCDWLDRAAEANINLLYTWMETPWLAALLGEPRYAEEYPFWDPDGWDALRALIEEAKSRGMEVHLWLSFTRYKRNREMVPEYDPELHVLSPGDPDWASITTAEYDEGLRDPADPAVSGSALCNNETAAHEWTLALYERLFHQYPGLCGLHIEEPGYLDLERCVCYRCQAVYETLNDDPGENLLGHVHSEIGNYQYDDAAVPVKTHGTDSFVRQLYSWWQNTHSEKILSFNGSFNASWDRVRGRNWVSWASDGLVPYFCPQIYTASIERFLDYLDTTIEDLTGSDTVVLPIVAVDWSGGSNDRDSVLAQLEAVRNRKGEDPIGGMNVFSGESVDDDLVQALRTGPFAEQVDLPWG